MGHHAPALPTAEEVTIPDGHLWTKLPPILFVTAILALAGAYFAADNKYGFQFAYLVGFLYAASIGLGSFFFVLIQHAGRAGWSVVVRRIAENMAAVMPLLILMFIPVFLARHDIYHHWMDPHAMDDPIIAGKSAYLNESAWIIRAFAYLVIWSGLGLWFWRKSVQQDSVTEPGRARAITLLMEKRSYPMIAIFALTLTGAAIDWGMSLDPHWFSTMWGVYFFAGSILAGFALLAVNLLLLQKTGLLTKHVNVEHLHDVGKLVFAFTVFWAYISFSQFFLIWYSNIPEETTWFHHRMGDGNPWESIGIILMAGHFGLPFLLMLPRTIKRHPVALLAAAVYMLCLHFIDLCYAILPANTHDAGTTVTVSALLCAIGLFSILWGAGIMLMRRSALLPVKDPRLSESLAFTNF